MKESNRVMRYLANEIQKCPSFEGLDRSKKLKVELATTTARQIYRVDGLWLNQDVGTNLSFQRPVIQHN